jgi:hypothetical protein
MLVCDECGRPVAETVTFKTSSGNRQKDYCSEHLRALLDGSRTPKRGRKPGTATGGTNAAATATRKRAARTRKASAASNGRRKATRRASGGRRRTKAN